MNNVDKVMSSLTKILSKKIFRKVEDIKVNSYSSKPKYNQYLTNDDSPIYEYLGSGTSVCGYIKLKSGEVIEFELRTDSRSFIP